MFGKVATSFLLISLATSSGSTGARIDPKCLEALAAHAAQNPGIITLPPRLAGPLGLADYVQTRQVRIYIDDGFRRALGIEVPHWTSTLIAKVGGGETYFYVVDRLGQLRRAVHAKGGKLTPLNINDADVIRRFSQEVDVWLRAASISVPGATLTVRENPCSP